MAINKKQGIGEVAESASGGVFKYGDVGRMTEADTPKLRVAFQLMASTFASAVREPRASYFKERETLPRVNEPRP
jgi:hypothetical protein